MLNIWKVEVCCFYLLGIDNWLYIWSIFLFHQRISPSFLSSRIILSHPITSFAFQCDFFVCMKYSVDERFCSNSGDTRSKVTYLVTVNFVVVRGSPVFKQNSGWVGEILWDSQLILGTLNPLLYSDINGHLKYQLKWHFN